jgi:hypothetical protein
MLAASWNANDLTACQRVQLQQHADQSQCGRTIDADDRSFRIGCTKTNTRVRVFANRDMPTGDPVGAVKNVQIIISQKQK